MSDPSLGPSVPLASPLYSSSVYNLPALDTPARVMSRQEAGVISARDGLPKARALPQKSPHVEGARGPLLAGPGRGPLWGGFHGSVPGSAGIASTNRLYGRTI